jgi:hypothetical protein
MSILPKEFAVNGFPCPNCHEFISSDVDACRFCSFEITEAFREEAVRDELEDRKRQSLKRAKNTMAIGATFFVAGLLATAVPFIESYVGARMINVSCFIPFMIIGGVATAIYGFSDYRKAKNGY